MASSTPSTDMTETVCQYPDCSKQLKDPKLLPCLHRYCRDCLTSVIRSASNKWMFKCSVCKQDCEITKNGVDEFKTDHHMTNKLLLIKLQDSVNNKHQNQLCGSCSKESTTPAYCFKCDTFLCQQCYQELPEKFQDHQPHTLNLETIKEKNLTLENLTPFTDPICAKHTTKRALLCCNNCTSVPICVTCLTDGMHKSHVLRDVVELAKSARSLLKKNDEAIDEQEKELYMIPSWAKAKKLQFKCKLAQNQSSREKAREKLTSKLMEDKKKLEQKYEQESKEVGAKHDKIRDDCNKELRNIDTLEKLMLESKQLVNEPEGIIDICKQLIQRNENIKATSSSITDSQDFWSDVQCIPYIMEANKSLLKRMEQALIGYKFQRNGTFKCAQRCTVCTNHLDECNQFTSHSRKTTHKTEGYITCETKNVIYLISCDICKIQYVGKTTDSLKKRFLSHKFNVNDKDKDESKIPLIVHFKSSNHSADNMRIQGIKRFIFPENILTEEKEWMTKLGTWRSDGGLNVK